MGGSAVADLPTLVEAVAVTPPSDAPAAGAIRASPVKGMTSGRSMDVVGVRAQAAEIVAMAIVVMRRRRRRRGFLLYRVPTATSAMSCPTVEGPSTASNIELEDIDDNQVVSNIMIYIGK